jgi:hypothetical protein
VKSPAWSPPSPPPTWSWATWALTRVALRGRTGRGTQGVVLGTVVAVVLAGLAWLCLTWLAARVDWVSPQ